MAYKTQASFTGGELDPALQERITLQKYDTGLKTGLNVIIGKTGRLISRPGRKHLVPSENPDEKIVLFTFEDGDLLLEFGDSYIRRVYSDGTTTETIATSYTEEDLPLIKVVNVELTSTYLKVLILCKGKAPAFLTILFVDLGDGFLSLSSNWNTGVGAAPTYSFVTASVASTNAPVEYVCSYIENGQESLYAKVTPTTYLPVLASERNFISFILGATTRNITAVKFYRRPAFGGAYGFIGYGTVTESSGNYLGGFSDIGGAADYTHQPPSLNPTLIDEALTDPGDFNSRTGDYYQRRVLLSYGEKLEASRINFYDNFYRDYPYSSDSSLSFGTEREVLHVVSSDGLVVFATDGVYLNSGALGPNNLTLIRKGNWVSDDIIKPIAVPGGVLFIDSKTNVVRELSYSLENGSYTGEELSIFSDHLFKGRKITSWAFEDGDTPLLWVTFIDGYYASFTYEKNQLMKAWTRHSSGYGIEHVVSMRNTINASVYPYERGPGKIYFVTNKDGQRYIEVGVPRYVSADTAAADSEWDKNESIAAMDAMVSWSRLINDELSVDDMVLTPVVTDDWEGELTLSITTDSIFTTGDLGAVGTTLRHFNPVDRTAVDLVVTARASDKSVTVQPSAEFPSAYASSPRLYECKSTFDGLDHLDNENVSIVADGYVLASPYNDIENYPLVTVASGECTLPNSYKGAIVHIGRPFISDIETLDIHTVEQRPTLIESKTVNKVYIKLHESRGIYVGNEFPSGNSVSGMSQLDNIDVMEGSVEILGNRYDQPTTKRHEVTIPGDWASEGRVCLRNVDPIHFEILSIIPDIDDQRR